MKRKYDYQTIRQEYVYGDVSLRSLAERHGISSISTLAEIAKKESWEQDRESFREKEKIAAAEAVSAKRAMKVAEMEGDILETIHAAVVNLAISLQDRVVEDPIKGVKVFIPAQQVTPDGLTKLIDKFLVMSGQVTNREAHLGFTYTSGPNDIPHDVLRQLRQLAEEQGAGAGPVGQSPLPRIDGPKQVN